MIKINIPHSLDYSLIPENIIFNPGMTGPQCQSISITDDSILENDEVFVAALSTTDQDVILNPSITSITILDDDGNINSKSVFRVCYVFCRFVHLQCTCIFNSVLYYVVVDNVSIIICIAILLYFVFELFCSLFTVVTVGFELTNYTVLESDAAANVCVVFIGGIERMFDVMIFTPDTSSGKQSLHSCILWSSILSNIPHSLDYSLIPESIIFSPGMTEPQCQSISITDDSILENDEVFVVALSSMDEDVILNPSNTSITILDDDGNVLCYESFRVCYLLIKTWFCTSIVYLLLHSVLYSAVVDNVSMYSNLTHNYYALY